MEWAAWGIEIVGAVVIVAGVLRIAITRGAVSFLFKLEERGAYREYKRQMGRSLMLGLDFLVAGDVVRTVALEATFVNLQVLGLLVLIRTFLSWSVAVEIEGHWPCAPHWAWQRCGNRSVAHLAVGDQRGRLTQRRRSML